MAKKLTLYAALAFVAYFVVTQPDSAASFTKALGGLVIGVARGFGDFFSRLAS